MLDKIKIFQIFDVLKKIKSFTRVKVDGESVIVVIPAIPGDVGSAEGESDC